MVLEVMKVVGPFMYVFVEAGFNFFTNDRPLNHLFTTMAFGKSGKHKGVFTNSTLALPNLHVWEPPLPTVAPMHH